MSSEHATSLILESYLDQREIWPKTGPHILAQFDDDSVVVYQAYNKDIGCYAAEHGRFGNGFSMSRMTWIKTNFLWMMYRSGWGTKRNQEVTLAIRIKRDFFEFLLENAVSSSFGVSGFESKEEWNKAKQGDIRLQWDPDHSPTGGKVERRAIQLGMRGECVEKYMDNIISIEDISLFVAAQRANAEAGSGFEKLITPYEQVYSPIDDKIIQLGKRSSRHASSS